MSELEIKQQIIRRRNSYTSALKRMGGLRHDVLPDDVHVWAVGRLRFPSPLFAHRADIRLPLIAETHEILSHHLGSYFFDKSCLFNPDIENFCSFMVDTSSLISAVRDDPYLISPDGIVVSDLHFTSFLVFDYDGLDPRLDGAGLTFTGLVALQRHIPA